MLFSILLATVLPQLSPTGPEPDLFGQSAGFPLGGRATWDATEYLVGSYSRFDSIFPCHRVAKSASPWQFQRAEREADIDYEFKGTTHSLADHLGHFPVTGLLILKGDTILFEHYQYGRTPADRFTSNSMAKSVMSLLAGVALGQGRIRSIDQTAADYAPALKGSDYGRATLRDLLHMSSGMDFDYAAPATDSHRLMEGLFSPGANMAAELARHHLRFPPATHFHYSGGDSIAVGIALHRAVGMSLSEYLERKIWQPMGAEADATWAADTSGQEFTFYGFNAVLRDWARLGRLMAHDGSWNGHQLIPRRYMIEATTLRPSERQVAPGTATPYYGYGFQIWILPGQRRMFVLRGTNSQYIFVDPQSKLVLVQTALRSESPHAEDGQSETLALWLAIVRQLGAEGTS